MEWYRGEALAWAESKLAQLRRQDPKRWSGSLVTGARQDNTERILFLEGHGFRYSGNIAEVNMICSLEDPIPYPVVPSDCQIRPLTETSELSNRDSAQREVWHPWTVGDISDDDYARLMKLPGYHCDLDVVAVASDGVIAAYVNGWVDPVNRIGDFGPVGARSAYRRRGLTRAVLLEGLRRMRDYGMKRVCVSTGISNTPALRLYQTIGFKIMNRYLDYIKKE